ncbi:MAG: C4-dicarboxylate ABC transporter substrate-binding protein [Gammaproteobacteria bacterium]|nr:MAG: C4-dicarboxylate ABC transporter substrate-binding protein [Gammaproteobacteria bacterium]
MKHILLSLLISAGFSSAFAESKWNMATPYPDSQFHTQNIKTFVEEIKTATGGDIDITVHAGASLYKAPEIFKAVRSGQVELGELLLSSLGNDDPIFKVDTLPFIATDYPSAKKLWEASREKITAELDKKGAVLLYAVPWPGQNFYSKAPIADSSYFKGKKLRSYNATTAEVATHLGAAPTTIEVSNIPQAFSTGQIDAMITSSATGVSSQAWDFVSNYTKVNAWLPKNMVFINKKTWNRLDKKTQTTLKDLAQQAEARGWALSEKVNAEKEKALADNGIIVSEANEALKKTLSNIGVTMSAAWLDSTGADGKAILDAYHAK